MSNQLLRKLFPLGQENVQDEQPPQSQITTMMIGDNEQYSTSLLFQCGYADIMEGNEVLFIRSEPINSLPFLIHGMQQPDRNRMSLLHFMYFTTVDDLLLYLGSVHQQARTPPAAVIVDQLHYFVTQLQACTDLNWEQAIAKVCALIVDAVSYFSVKLGRCCQLLVNTEDIRMGAMYEKIGQHFFNTVFMLTQHQGTDGRDDICLGVLRNRDPGFISHVYFYCENQRLFLKEAQAAGLPKET